CLPPPTAWTTDEPTVRPSTHCTPVGRALPPLIGRLRRARGGLGPLPTLRSSDVADTGPRPRAGTKWNPENHFQEGVSKTRSRAGPHAHGRGCRRCPAASRPRRDGPPVGRKTALRPKKHLSDGQFGPLVSGCPGRALNPGRCADSRLAPTRPPFRSLVLERNGSPKTTCRRGFRRPALGPGRTPTAEAAADAPLPNRRDPTTRQRAEKPVVDPKRA